MAGPSSIRNRVRAVILLASVVVLLVTTAAFVIYEVLSFRERLVRDLSTTVSSPAEAAAIYRTALAGL